MNKKEQKTMNKEIQIKERSNNKILFPYLTTWSYIKNENGKALRVTLEGFGSCTPADELQKWIDGLTKKQFNNLWKDVENSKDVID
jgi:hypothetical protein